MLTQTEKGQAFRTLHERDKAFIIPNPWDVGSARLLAQLGIRKAGGIEEACLIQPRHETCLEAGCWLLLCHFRSGSVRL
jgi:hypothetical protein